MSRRDDKKRELIVAEYLEGEASYRELEMRYGIGSSTLHRWVTAAGLEAGRRKAKEEGGEPGGTGSGEAEENLAAEVRRLRGELRKAELHNKLLNAMIDIAEDQMGIPIRKKSGAKR